MATEQPVCGTCWGTGRQWVQHIYDANYPFTPPDYRTVLTYTSGGSGPPPACYDCHGTGRAPQPEKEGKDG